MNFWLDGQHSLDPARFERTSTIPISFGGISGYHSFEHFDQFFNGQKPCDDMFKERFPESTIKDRTKWELLELFKTAYTLYDTLHIYIMGGSHICYRDEMRDALRDAEKAMITFKDLVMVLNGIHKICGYEPLAVTKDMLNIVAFNSDPTLFNGQGELIYLSPYDTKTKKDYAKEHPKKKDLPL